MTKRKNLSLEELENAIRESKTLVRDFVGRNGNSSLRIPNKDMNLWMMNEMLRQNGRIGKLEATTKILATIFCGLIIKIVIF